MKILIVDDSPTMRRIVINSLRTFDYEDVAEANDGIQALEILQTEKIDFIITEWNTPNMTGLELTQAIRATENLKHTPVLMVSTRVNKEDIIQAVQARVSNYLVKPFTPQALKEKMDSIFASIAKQ